MIPSSQNTLYPIGFSEGNSNLQGHNGRRERGVEDRVPSSHIIAKQQEAHPSVHQHLAVWPSVPQSSRLHGDIVPLPQFLYRGGLSMHQPQALPIMQFGCFNLQSAIDENYDTLLGAEQLAWEASINLPTKLAVVFCFPGYPLYNRQVTVLTAHRVPPTRGKMARIIAQEMRKFLDKARTEYQRPVCWYGREVSLADLFLGYMQHVSRGSLQAQIGIRFCQLASWVPETPNP